MAGGPVKSPPCPPSTPPSTRPPPSRRSASSSPKSSCPCRAKPATQAGRPCSSASPAARCAAATATPTYAFFGGEWWDIDAILAEVAKHGVRHVCVTGGEPLAQKRVHRPAVRNSAMPVTSSRWKPPARSTSATSTRASRASSTSRPRTRAKSNATCWENLPLLTPHDQVKFVICSREDFDWACKVLFEHSIA